MNSNEMNELKEKLKSKCIDDVIEVLYELFCNETVLLNHDDFKQIKKAIKEYINGEEDFITGKRLY